MFLLLLLLLFHEEDGGDSCEENGEMLSAVEEKARDVKIYFFVGKSFQLEINHYRWMKIYPSNGLQCGRD